MSTVNCEILTIIIIHRPALLCWAVFGLRYGQARPLQKVLSKVVAYFKNKFKILSQNVRFVVL